MGTEEEKEAAWETVFQYFCFLLDYIIYSATKPRFRN